jgi:C4-dicarboxylate transporter, DctQ subunit
MRFLQRRADNVIAFLMVVIFVTFIIQIFMRYLAQFQLAKPYIWTQDLTSSVFVWIILFGGGVALVESDHVKFDTVYNLFGVGVRRIMSIITSLAIVGFFLYSLPAVWEYLSVLHRFGKPNATLKWPFSDDKPILIAHIYSIYLVFAVVVMIRYAVRAVRLIMGAAPEDLDPPMIEHEGGAS